MRVIMYLISSQAFGEIFVGKILGGGRVSETKPKACIYIYVQSWINIFIPLC